MSNVPEEHPARLAAKRSMEAVHAKDKDAWIANFADDGVTVSATGGASGNAVTFGSVSPRV